MMRVPGSNLLNKAFTKISQQQLIYYSAIGRTLNIVGQYVTQYAAGVAVSGSFQPVPRVKYEYMGLDFQKEYYFFYVSKDLIDLTRDISADQLAFQGIRYQIQSNTEWFGIDGWLEILVVNIGADTQQPNIFGFNSTEAPNSNQNFDNGNFVPTPNSGPNNQLPYPVGAVNE